MQPCVAKTPACRRNSNARRPSSRSKKNSRTCWACRRRTRWTKRTVQRSERTGTAGGHRQRVCCPPSPAQQFLSATKTGRDGRFWQPLENALATRAQRRGKGSGVPTAQQRTLSRPSAARHVCNLARRRSVRLSLAFDVSVFSRQSASFRTSQPTRTSRRHPSPSWLPPHRINSGLGISRNSWDRVSGRSTICMSFWMCIVAMCQVGSSPTANPRNSPRNWSGKRAKNKRFRSDNSLCTPIGAVP